MLVGITALAKAAQTYPFDSEKAAEIQSLALAGVLFYLAAYGIMNSGAFGVLMMLPSRDAFTGRDQRQETPIAMTAETYDDLAGQGKKHVALGLAMAVCCFSLIGIPLTIGFIGKTYLILPALSGGLTWLVVITMVNAAVSAAYYLKIVATMFLRPAPDAQAGAAEPIYAAHHAAPHGLAALAHAPFALSAAVLISVVATLLFGTVVPAAESLTRHSQKAASTGGFSTDNAAPGTPASPGTPAVAAQTDTSPRAAAR
jgi:NADH-quinone oxidoreductase subunit N